MAGQRIIPAEFLADDLREIRNLIPSGMGEKEGLERVVREALAAYRSDEATWQTTEHQHDALAAATQLEMKRREAAALLVSMRSRTIRSEVEMYDLRERVRGLQERHAEQRARADVLQRSIARLRRRIARVDGQLSDKSPSPTPVGQHPSALRRALAMLWRRQRV